MTDHEKEILDKIKQSTEKLLFRKALHRIRL